MRSFFAPTNAFVHWLRMKDIRGPFSATSMRFSTGDDFVALSVFRTGFCFFCDEVPRSTAIFLSGLAKLAVIPRDKIFV